LFQELEAKEVLDLEPVDFPGPVPLELLKGFQDGEAGGFDPRLDDMLAALLVLAVDESAEIIDVAPGLLRRLLSQFGVLSL
jgi:hypothetical protein